MPYLPQPRRALPAIVLLLLLAASPAFAWRVVSFARVPGRTSAMTVINGALWCGYNRADTTIKVIDPNSGEVTATHPAPEVDCLGLTSRDGSLWFLGREHLYQLSMRGEVQATVNLPFDHMKGLAVFGAGLWTVVIGDNATHLVQFHPQAGELRRVEINVFEVGGVGWNGTNFWITEPSGGFIHQVDTTGRTAEIYPTPAYSPRGVAFNQGAFYLVDSGDDEAGDVLYQMSLEAEVSPRLMPSGDLHNFGLVNVRGTVIWNLGLFNVGASDLTVSEIHKQIPDTTFSLGQLQLPVTIHAGQVSIVRVAFTPPDYGVFADTISIISDDPIEDTIQVIVHGVGVYTDRVLAISPEPINFDTVRAEPLRDGSRHIDVSFINKGAFELTISNISNRITEIFAVTQPDLPLLLQPADTFACRVWFTPHRRLQYIDTLVVQSNGLAPWVEAILMGRGDDRNAPAGSVLWEKQIQAGAEGSGATALHTDINRDGVKEVVAVSSLGNVICINGFASGNADVLWEQRFDGATFNPEGIASHGALEAGVSLGANASGDIVFGSGSPDGAVYALNGLTGELLWRWDAGIAEAGDRIKRVLLVEDFEGNGSFDPVVMSSDGSGSGAIARLEGTTGRAVWMQYFEHGTFLEASPDMNGDGLGEYVLAGGSEMSVFSGADGSLIHRLENIEGVSTLQPLGRVTQDAGPLVLIGREAGGAVALDVINGREIWRVTESPNAGTLDTVKLVRFYRGLGGPLLAVGDVDGRIVVVDNPATGHIRYDVIGRERLSSLAWAWPDDRTISFNLLAGYSSGRVIGFNSSDSLWGWNSATEEAVVDVLSFQDIDFGGSKDVVALSADGYVRCLSSGGDLAAPRQETAIPVASSLILYPNPFNGSALLKVNLPMASPISVEVFDLLGRSLARQNLGYQPAGQVEIGFNQLNDNSAGGVLFFRVETMNGFSTISGQYVK